MIDSTFVDLKIWVPSKDSFKFTVGRLKHLLSKIPNHFTVTIDDMDWICYEVDGEGKRIDLWRDYKGD